MLPKLSIITINYNNLAGLRKTVESVFVQTYRDFEYIIIDGASTDGSCKYLNSIQIGHSQATYKFVTASNILSFLSNIWLSDIGLNGECLR